MVGRACACGDLRPERGSSSPVAALWVWAWVLAGMAFTDTSSPWSPTLGLEPIIARMLSAYGVRVEQVAEPHPEGGWQQARCDRVAQLLAEDPAAWNPDQYNNLANVDAYRDLAGSCTPNLAG